MKDETAELLEKISHKSIIDFFKRSISNFKTEIEELDHIKPNNGYDQFINLKKHGEASYDDGDELIVFSCRYDGELKTRSSKKKQYELAKKALKDDFKDGAIFIFYDANNRFRFSFIRRTYGEDNKYTPWSRYTFFVHPEKRNKTWVRRIEQCSFRSLDEIQEAFSVEPLSKQFYRDLSNWYFAALQEVKFPNERGKDEYVVQANALIRLITRLMFIWFMKQKGLVPDNLFEKDFIDGLLKYEDKTGSTYYKTILQNLFFATLNTPRERGRKFVNRQYGISNFYRYRRFLKDENTFLELMDKVPFLNGGLFENLDIIDQEEDIEIRIDCFSDNKKNEEKLTVPDYLFFGEFEADISEYFEGSKNNNETITGIIDILNRYDFTIDENTPTDQEVALDPELLGLVFENLLASYNPETESTARKESGSFYTPRPIVDYMVIESLSQYLKDATGIPLEDIKQVFKDIDNHSLANDSDKEKLIDAMSQLKIIDPACGSGAFPMGILQKMVHALAKIDPDNVLWRASQERRIKNSIAERLDEMTLEDIQNELDRTFDNKQNDPDYARKLYLIENCLYGVDIQPIAMQISKLRFFISLLVEQRIDGNAVNFGIVALPNLETKFVAANTLIKLKKPVSGRAGQANQLFLKNVNLEKLEDQLDECRHKYFTARTPKTKKKYRQLIKDIRSQMSEILESDGWDSSEAKKVSQWDPFDPNGKSKWFDKKWMFGLESFDIVIGNPPYIQLQKALPRGSGTKYADVYKDQQYSTFERTGDIYALFYEKGMDMLHSKGILCYITSNKWMRAKYGKSLRKYCSQKNPLQLIDLGAGVFDAATVDVNILLMQNSKIEKNTLRSLTLKDKEKIDNLKKDDFTLMNDLNSDSWIILSPEEQVLKKKIERIGKPLKEWEIKINRGILTGYNDAFIIDRAVKDKLISEDPKSAEIIRPILRGRDIKRYKAEFADKWLISTHNGYKNKDGKRVDRVDVKDYPAVKKWLDNHWIKLEKRADQGDTPYNLRNCAYMEDFEKSIIVWGNLALNAQFTISESGMIINAPSPILSTSETWVLSILNSKVVDYYIRLLGVTRNGGYFEYKPMFVEKVPLISDLKLEYSSLLSDYVTKIINLKNDDKVTKELEEAIDLIVYKLYELTYEEVFIIDPETEITFEEYESFKLEE